jgi:hypothetical protein
MNKKIMIYNNNNNEKINYIKNNLIIFYIKKWIFKIFIKHY